MRIIYLLSMLFVIGCGESNQQKKNLKNDKELISVKGLDFPDYARFDGWIGRNIEITPIITDKEDNFGLLQHNYEPKPAYYEYKDIIEEKLAKEIEIKEVLTRMIEILNKLIQFYAQLIQLLKD